MTGALTYPIFAGPTFWTERIDSSSVPIDPNSAVIVADLTRQIQTGAGRGVIALSRDSGYESSFMMVPPGTPKINILHVNQQNKPAHWLTGLPAFMNNIPLPANAIPSSGSDAMLEIYDPETDTVYGWWKLRYDYTWTRMENGQEVSTFYPGWSAVWGGRIQNASQGFGQYPRPYGVSASGLMMMPGAITLEDMRKRKIEHSLYMTVKEAGPRTSWPANRNDGLTPGNPITEGQRLKIKRSFDLTAWFLVNPAHLVCRLAAHAARKYGIVVMDKGDRPCFHMETGAYERAATGIDPYKKIFKYPDYYNTPGMTDHNGDGVIDSYSLMKNFPYHALEAVAIDYGKPV